MADEQPLHDLIDECRDKYDLTKNIYCPFMKEIVYFNNQGFHHATHDGRGHIRNEADARMRLHLLSCVNDVIERASHFVKPPELVPKIDPNNKTNKEIQYYELEYRFSATKQVIVVLRKIGNGRLHYYSIRYAKKKQTR